MATEFTENSVKEFILRKGGRVKNHELVTHFKNFLNDSARKEEMREKFKNYVNTLATIKLDENKEKVLMLKKRYMYDTGGGAEPDQGARAQSEPPGNTMAGGEDRVDGRLRSRVQSDKMFASSDTVSSNPDTQSLTSPMSSSSLSSATFEEDSDASVLSVRERALHLNRMESESDIQRTSGSNLGAVRGKNQMKKGRDLDGDDSSTSSVGYSPLVPIEKEWLVKSSSSEYHLMNELLSKNPGLARVRDFTSGVSITLKKGF
ncbi:uncharacterized protein LOC128242731 [Mya arenaria]|uniref:uncharacterized protein LOC128242731 n=1 Tax=Mya arenaria TaxID=6604 RepID=UPI0022E6FD85|nr:uncharacterized protein LOC128242731 [Mya arenaria]XP_052815955.1 uncharacterized protein LOC128242731 [Mya arenaria]XP_052815956.1 uncharacterized protein LOC128242731 [Mya arenaria]XP_052815957.1 uncharacterized protein LOC128242731 [Mya arenaria]XP_052815958.1 uncharacterized protein LOC128242731 [Mya arenaria]XP_052815959.1 uncharacterized protein LOC128242731 [Mya arenaria]